jgi:hypothetical protein
MKRAFADPIVRCACKAALLFSYQMCVAGTISFATMFAVHLAYIAYSTWVDARAWLTDGVDSRARWQMVHHAATWWLVAVFAGGGPHFEETTRELLGAVDATDMAFYAFKAVPRTQANQLVRTGLQLVFAVVWVLRRVLVFGEGDWGRSIYRAAREQFVLGGWTSGLILSIPASLLLLVNWVWTAKLF